MWGVRSRHKDNGGNGAGGRQVWLHELVEAITTALIAATRPIQEQHIAAVQETFTGHPTETESQASEGLHRDLIPESEGGSPPSTSKSPAEPAAPGFDFRDKLLRPETLLMELPAIGSATGDEGMAYREQQASDEQSGVKLAVPTAALMQSNALVIDEATIELECIFDRFATEVEGRRSCASRLGVWLDRTGIGSPARIVIKFKRVDRPEGASRIEDALLRNLQ